MHGARGPPDSPHLSVNRAEMGTDGISLCFLQIEQRLVHAQNLTQGWEEIKHLKAELWIYLQDADQQLQNMKRRHAELELNLAQNMVTQVKVGTTICPRGIREAKNKAKDTMDAVHSLPYARAL